MSLLRDSFIPGELSIFILIIYTAWSPACRSCFDDFKRVTIPLGTAFLVLNRVVKHLLSWHTRVHCCQTLSIALAILMTFMTSANYLSFFKLFCSPLVSFESGGETTDLLAHSGALLSNAQHCISYPDDFHVIC